MKYIKQFDTEEEYNLFKESGALIRPNVSLVNEPYAIYYDKYIPNGVFIQHVDGTLYTPDEWTGESLTNDKANGVAVVTDSKQFVVSKYINSTLYPWHSNTSDIIEGVGTTVDDLSGKKNTEIMLTTDTSGVAFNCASYTFPNGDKGYVPAIGELEIAYLYKTDIKSALKLIGGSSIGNYQLWSSTQTQIPSHAYLKHLGYDGAASTTKSSQLRIWIFAPLLSIKFHKNSQQ